MNILSKFKETAFSVLPVMILVLVLGLVAVSDPPAFWLGRFFTGGVLLIIGLTIFLLGVDLGIQPMGEQCGASLTARKNLLLLLGAALVIGIIVTAAEPDIQVFGDQVCKIFPSVNKTALTLSIASGVGIFMAVGLLRIVLRVSIKLILCICYAIILAICAFTPAGFAGIAFDSGGATTGPMTVPFIMALGLGVAAVRADRDGAFGLTGIASVGPVSAVLIYSFFTSGGNTAQIDAAIAETSSFDAGFWSPFIHEAPKAFHEAVSSILPLFALFLVFQFALLRLSRRQVLRLTIGFIYAVVGLSVFLLGVNGGFMQAGEILGTALGAKAAAGGIAWPTVLILTGLALGAIIVCAEPAVWVLSEQVEQVTGGTIPRKLLLLFLSIGTSIAIALALLRAVRGFPIAWVLLPGYIVAFLLMAKSPTLFTSIAFDSGGVASGPLTSTFILSFTIGAASGGSGESDLFGVIALVAMMPLLAIQAMGIIYEHKQKVKAK